MPFKLIHDIMKDPFRLVILILNIWYFWQCHDFLIGIWQSNSGLV